MHLFRTLLLIAVFAQPALAQDVDRALAAIRPQAIRAHMGFLADDLLEGRGTATRGHEIAARYVAARFEELGLEPAGTGGTWYQPVPLLKMTTVRSECSLTLFHEGGEVELEHGPDFAASLVAEGGSVTAPVVFAGFGVTAPELDYDDYAGIDARGKIVAVLYGAPPTFPNDQRAYYSDNTVQLRNAFAHGAAGVLTIFTPELERMWPWEEEVKHLHWPSSSWVNAQGRPDFSRPNAVALSRQGGEKLFAGAPQSLEETFKRSETGRPGSFDLPVEATLRTAGRVERVESPNVAAVLRGSDPRLKEEYVVLSAHLDHVGVEPGETSGDDPIHNGAYDNASGVAVLLEVAKAFASLPPPRRSVLFLAVTGEEDGLNGSDYFARHPTVPAERIVANTNLDMFLMLYPLRDVIAFGAEHSTLERTVKEAAARLGIGVSPDPFPEQVLFIRSDHYSFVQQGVPAIFLTGGFQTDDPAVDGQALWSKWMQEVYHKPGDDMSQDMDFEAGAQFARLNFLVSYKVAQDEEAPAWKEGDFFGDRFGRFGDRFRLPGVLRSGRP